MLLPEVPFYVVGTRKLVVLGLLTLGAYELYWFYRQWQRLREVDREDVWPPLRAVFSLFFSYALFQRVALAATIRGVPNTLRPGPTAAVFAGLILAQRLPDPWPLLAMVSVAPLIPVQRVVNALPEVQALPSDQRNERFTPWEWAVAAVGGLVTLVVLLGVFVQGPRPDAAGHASTGALVDEAQRDLPRTMFGGAALDRVESTSAGIEFHVRLEHVTAKEALGAGVVGRAQYALLQLACTGTGLDRAVLDRGVALRYRISDRDRAPVATMEITSRAQCAALGPP